MVDSQPIILVKNFHSNHKATLILYDNFQKVFETEAFVGENGITPTKLEGDGKTPMGIFNLGLAFGTHSREETQLHKSIKYITINKSLYWIDDIYSKYYNQLVDITKVKRDWNSAEHLIEYPRQYEYSIEIKANRNNIPGKRKCNFLTLQCR